MEHVENEMQSGVHSDALGTRKISGYSLRIIVLVPPIITADKYSQR